METKWQECPSCQVVLPVHAEYVTWCDQCGWNVNPLAPRKPRNIFEGAYTWVGQKQSQAILDRLVKTKRLEPTLSVSKVLAFVVAALIHGTTLVFVVGGVMLLIGSWPNVCGITGGILCFGIAWVLRPRFAKPPSTAVSRNEVPTLYKLVELLADSLDAPDVREICVDGQFGASFWQVGLQHKGVLCVGLPLWSILTNQEKVALLAHELAHSVNGDVTRGRFIGTAIGALVGWYGLLHPDHIWAPGSGIRGLPMIPFNLLLLALCQAAILGAFLMSHLLWRDTQRAEYLADHLAASVAGTDAMLSLLDKLHLGKAFTTTLHRVTLSREADLDLFEELRRCVEEAPQREIERIRRVQQHELSRLDVTHPPTMNRIELLRSHGAHHPKVIFPSRILRDWKGSFCR
jgi:hypothetical protein